MESIELFQAQINYYNDAELYTTAMEAAKAGVRAHGNNAEMNLWIAIGNLFLGRTSDALRNLQALPNDRVITLASLLAQRDAHKKAKQADKETVASLDSQIKTETKSCGEMALYHGALYLWHSGKNDKARDLSDKLLKLNKNSVHGNTVRGWIDLTSGRETYINRAPKYFDEAIRLSEQTPQATIGAWFGRARWLLLRNEASQALDLLNTVCGLHQRLIPAIIEKCAAHAALSQWDVVVDQANRALELEQNCIQAHRILALHELCRVGDYDSAGQKIGELIIALDTAESKNHKAYYESCRFISRLSGRHTTVLQQASTLLDRALKLTKSLQTENAKYVVEQGYLHELRKSYREAIDAFKRAMEIDDTCVEALTGLILCQINTDQVDEAAQQLEFLNEIFSTDASLGRSIEISFLSALLKSKKHEDINGVVTSLDEAVDKQIISLEQSVGGFEHFITLNPDLMLEIAKLYLQYGPSDAPDGDHTPSPILVKAQRVLELLMKTVPGMIEGVFLLAKVKYLSGAIDAAKSGVRYCLQLDNTYADGHLLMARIDLEQGNTSAAAQDLEFGTSYNFEIRDSPLYFSIKAKIEQAEGKLSDSINTLQKAYKIVKTKQTPSSSKKRTKRAISEHDRVTIFLELADALWKNKKTHESAKMMQDTMAEFADTPEEMRIKIANADMAIKRGDVEVGLEMLGKITPQQSYYVQAKQRMANIYLQYRKDKELYAACYRDLVAMNPTPHTYLLMGDAYMRIQDPEKAISVYEQALQKNPTDSVLARKIGKALVKTHDYKKAILYYESALKNGAQHELRGDLADLHIKLKNYSKAETALQEGIQASSASDVDTIMAKVKLQMTSARLESEKGNPAGAITALNQAKASQRTVLKRVEREQPDALQQQQAIGCKLCIMIAKIHSESLTGGQNLDKAITKYQEALSYDDSSEEALMSLSKLYLESNEVEKAEKELQTLRRTHKGHIEAAMMLADICAHNRDFDKAIFHYQQILERKPDHYAALVNLIDLLRTSGIKASAKNYVDMATVACPRPSIDPGLHYCKGLFHWMMGEPDTALKAFNLARQDSDWGTKALIHMIHILMNPEAHIFAGEAYIAAKAKNAEGANNRLNTIEVLVRELYDRTGDTKETKTMRAYYMLSSHKREGIKQATELFSQILQEDEQFIPALLGRARALVCAQQGTKARHPIKMIMGLNWSAEYADEFEGAWLLHAEMFFGMGKQPEAQKSLKKCLAYNKSCGKAWELMGKILEKDGAYVNAAEFYESAWEHCNSTDPAIGFRLAFNYYKATKYVEAIDICHAVLKHTPTYPKIKKEILERCREKIKGEKK